MAIWDLDSKTFSSVLRNSFINEFGKGLLIHRRAHLQLVNFFWRTLPQPYSSSWI
jgi:hypothetical protein